MATNKDEITVADIAAEIIKNSTAKLQDVQTTEEYLKYAPVIADMCFQYMKNTY